MSVRIDRTRTSGSVARSRTHSRAAAVFIFNANNQCKAIAAQGNRSTKLINRTGVTRIELLDHIIGIQATGADTGTGSEHLTRSTQRFDKVQL